MGSRRFPIVMDACAAAAAGASRRTSDLHKQLAAASSRWRDPWADITNANQRLTAALTAFKRPDPLLSDLRRIQMGLSQWKDPSASGAKQLRMYTAAAAAADHLSQHGMLARSSTDWRGSMAVLRPSHPFLETLNSGGKILSSWQDQTVKQAQRLRQFASAVQSCKRPRLGVSTSLVRDEDSGLREDPRELAFLIMGSLKKPRLRCPHCGRFCGH